MNKSILFSILVVAIFNITLGGLCTEYCLETWLSYFQHKTVDIPFFACAIIGLFFGEIAIPAFFATWLIFLFL